MLDFMTGYYDKMKINMGINEQIAKDQDDADLEDVL
jgi:hypothetical protein